MIVTESIELFGTVLENKRQELEITCTAQRIRQELRHYKWCPSGQLGFLSEAVWGISLMHLRPPRTLASSARKVRCRTIRCASE